MRPETDGDLRRILRPGERERRLAGGERRLRLSPPRGDLSFVLSRSLSRECEVSWLLRWCLRGGVDADERRREGEWRRRCEGGGEGERPYDGERRRRGPGSP